MAKIIVKPEMNLLIHIEINEVNKLHFQKDILKETVAAIPGLNAIDFDNHSEAFMVDLILKLSKEAEKIAIIIDVESAEAGQGGVVRFLNTLLRLKKEYVMIIFNGEQEMLFKMIRVFKNHHITLDHDAQKNKLLGFFKA